MQRIAAHRITYEGRDYTMSYAELLPDSTVVIRPLTEEIHSTRFISGHILLTLTAGRLHATPLKP